MDSNIKNRKQTHYESQGRTPRFPPMIKLMVLIWIPIMLISVFHYAMPHSLHWTHDILRILFGEKLYYNCCKYNNDFIYSTCLY
jgi:hypothetical protein